MGLGVVFPQESVRQPDTLSSNQEDWPTVIDWIINNTPQGSGIVRAGVNGGFFGDSVIIGHVGVGQNPGGTNSWPGNNMLIRRWNFGMRETGSDRLIDRMVLVLGTQSTYTLHPNVRKFPYGFSGIGVLIWGGTPRNLDDDDDSRPDEDGLEYVDEGGERRPGRDSDQQDDDRDGMTNEDPSWPYSGDPRPRTAIAWDDRGHFYLIVFEGDPGGVTWQETVNFFRTELPRWMREELPNFVANEPAYEGARVHHRISPSKMPSCWMVEAAVNLFGDGQKGGDNEMVHGSSQSIVQIHKATQFKVEESRHWWMCMRWHRNMSFATFCILVFAMLLLLTVRLFCAETQVSFGFLHWKPLQTTCDSQIEIDNKHRWVAQLDSRGWKGWLKVWELKEDLTVGEKVLDIGGRIGEGFFVNDIEWVGDRLLISITEGYDTFWEWDKQMEEGTLATKIVPWRAKWLIFDPNTRQMRDLGENKDLVFSKLFAHPSGEKVLIVKRRSGPGPWQVKVVSLPFSLLVKPEIVRELSFPYKLVGREFSPINWTPDGQHFWAIGTDKLFVIRTDGSIKRLTPNDYSLYVALGREGGIMVEGMAIGVVTPSGEYAVLTMFTKPEQERICLAYYSQERLEREVVLLDVNRPYPSYLRPLGVCRLKAIVPDGQRLIIQEGWSASYGEKKRVWVWDIKAGFVKPLAELGWIEEVYGWIGSEWMVVRIRGEPIEVEVQHDVGGKWVEKVAPCEYGLLHVPKD